MTDKTDRELLELAAKAWIRSGMRLECPDDDGGIYVCRDQSRNGHTWNPLTDDGDALRLAARLKLSLLQHPDGMDITVVFPPATGCPPLAEQQTLGREEGMRRAIVRAAAAIGEAMQ